MALVKSGGRPPSFEEWLGRSPATVQTLRSLLASPGASPVAALERSIGDPAVVVRTLHHLQNAGLVKIEIEKKTMDLVVRVDAPRRTTLEELLRRIS